MKDLEVRDRLLMLYKDYENKIIKGKLDNSKLQVSHTDLKYNTLIKIINPKKKVLLPDLKAGCSLADSCHPKDFALFKAKYPNAVVVSYINCSAEIKTFA